MEASAEEGDPQVVEPGEEAEIYAAPTEANQKQLAFLQQLHLSFQILEKTYLITKNTKAVSQRKIHHSNKVLKNLCNETCHAPLKHILFRQHPSMHSFQY